MQIRAMPFPSTSHLSPNIPLYKVSHILSLSSSRAQLERCRPDPDLRKMLGHTKLFAEIESLDCNPNQLGLATLPSYTARRGRRVSKSFHDLCDDGYECDTEHDNLNRPLSSHVEVVNATPPVLWTQHRRGAEEPDNPNNIESHILSTHRISYDDTAELTSSHASGQVRAIVVSMEEVDLT